MEEKKYIEVVTFTGDNSGNKHVGYTVDDVSFVLRQFALEEKEKTEKDDGYKGRTILAIITGGDEEDDDIAIVSGKRYRSVVEDLSGVVRDCKTIHDIFMAVFFNCAKRGYIDAEMIEVPAAEKPVSKQTIS